MDVTVSLNSTAMAFVPAEDVATVTESGKPACEVKGMKFSGSKNAVIYAIGSGRYQFQSQP